MCSFIEGCSKKYSFLVEFEKDFYCQLHFICVVISHFIETGVESEMETTVTVEARMETGVESEMETTVEAGIETGSPIIKI